MLRVMPLMIEYARGEDDELKTHVLQVNPLGQSWLETLYRVFFFT